MGRFGLLTHAFTLPFNAQDDGQRDGERGGGGFLAFLSKGRRMVVPHQIWMLQRVEDTLLTLNHNLPLSLHQEAGGTRSTQAAVNDDDDDDEGNPDGNVNNDGDGGSGGSGNNLLRHPHRHPQAALSHPNLHNYPNYPHPAMALLSRLEDGTDLLTLSALLDQGCRCRRDELGRLVSV